MTQILKINTKGLFFTVAAALLLSLCLQSCAKKFSFQTSALVPAAEGKVKVKKDNSNGNYRITLNVVRLAKPERLTPPRDVYVVWVLSESNSAQNIGQLRTSSGMFSKSLKSSLNTVTSFKLPVF